MTTQIHPEKQEQRPVSLLPRLETVDALRGFAVMAILLVHNVEHFIFPVYPDKASLPAWLNMLDEGVFSVVFALFAGKSYAIFALLFGFTFYIMYAKQAQQGKDFGLRFAWRLLLLMLFATINAAFFPAGDVLLLYAVTGFFLILVRKWGDRTVLLVATILLCQPVEWFHCIASLVNPSYALPNLGVGEMYAEVARYCKEGNFWTFLWRNATYGQVASFFWAIGAGRYIQTAGLFMLGMLLGRRQLFVPSASSNRFWVCALIIAAVLFGPVYQLKVLVYDNADSAMARQTVGVVLDMWQKLAFTTVLVASFVLLYQNVHIQKLTANLRFYGRMSLSNYIGQSIAGAFIYFPFGMYMASRCGYTLSLLIGIVVFLLQVQFCKWWLQRHKQGPFEYVWHKLTWLHFGK